MCVHMHMCVHTHTYTNVQVDLSQYTQKSTHVHTHIVSVLMKPPPPSLSPSPVPSPILLSHPSSISSPVLSVRFHCEIIMLLVDWLVGCHFTLTLFGEHGSLLLGFKCLLHAFLVTVHVPLEIMSHH